MRVLVGSGMHVDSGLICSEICDHIGTKYDPQHRSEGQAELTLSSAMKSMSHQMLFDFNYLPFDFLVVGHAT